MEKVQQAQITAWINHPVTQYFLTFLKQNRDRHKDQLEEIILSTSAHEVSKAIGTLTQLKGQIHVLDQILDIRDFLLFELTDADLLEVNSMEIENEGI